MVLFILKTEEHGGFLSSDRRVLSLGQYFIVEDDVRELAQMKVDKRFQGILNMLRHCQRFREVRGGGVTRYLLL